MDFGKFESGSFQVNCALFRLSELCARVELEIAPLCAEKGLRWKLEMDDVVVWTDQELFLRLLRNLLTNAVRYTEVGEVFCSAKSHGDVVEFLISDTGPGIHPDHHASVFDKFVSLQKGGVGTAGIGIGLSIVEKINQALLLNLTMISVVGTGTQFRFRVRRDLVR